MKCRGAGYIRERNRQYSSTLDFNGCLYAYTKGYIMRSECEQWRGSCILTVCRCISTTGHQEPSLWLQRAQSKSVLQGGPHHSVFVFSM